jgi:ATP-dependent DNA helicase DinG
LSSTHGLIEAAFRALSKKPGFVDRPDQKHLALLIGDCIAEGATGVFEAPTGLGKSLAALIPAIAHAIDSGKRTVIATYTNVLAEQYWKNDLPLALSLFEGEEPSTEFLIGRQRYACIANIEQNAPQLIKPFVYRADKGVESELRQLVSKRGSDMSRLWEDISAPPVCAARLCDRYDRCFYYRARRSAERAEIVITNHSVVLQDAILRYATDDEMSLFGNIDFVILDEAHDFPQAAQSAFEFELSEERLGVVIGVVNKAEESILEIAAEADSLVGWTEACEKFRTALTACAKSLHDYGLELRKPGILVAAPDEVRQHPQVVAMSTQDLFDKARSIANEVADSVDDFIEVIGRMIEKWDERRLADSASETLRNYEYFIREFGAGSRALFSPTGVSVSYSQVSKETSKLRYDTIGLAEPLSSTIWERFPTVSMSATLAIDKEFGFYKELTGCVPAFQEILPSPFDFRSQAALYLPKQGTIPDPTTARKQGTESEYFDAVAREVGKIITALHGRTLVLFHSRREMDEVRDRVETPDELPIYVQGRYGVATVGEKFKAETHASLFALRSFWTGFDAPGDTLSCVVLVRVPFEVPVDPPQVARQAWMESKGQNPFMSYSLPLAKMLMRQGAGRLIRSQTDRGIIAVLDTRLTTKRYGQEILDNLPEGMKAFHDIYDAIAHVGLGNDIESSS